MSATLPILPVAPQAGINPQPSQHSKTDQGFDQVLDQVRREADPHPVPPNAARGLKSTSPQNTHRDAVPARSRGTAEVAGPERAHVLRQDHQSQRAHQDPQISGDSSRDTSQQTDTAIEEGNSTRPGDSKDAKPVSPQDPVQKDQSKPGNESLMTMLPTSRQDLPHDANSSKAPTQVEAPAPRNDADGKPEDNKLPDMTGATVTQLAGSVPSLLTVPGNGDGTLYPGSSSPQVDVSMTTVMVAAAPPSAGVLARKEVVVTAGNTPPIEISKASQNPPQAELGKASSNSLTQAVTFVEAKEVPVPVTPTDAPAGQALEEKAPAVSPPPTAASAQPVPSKQGTPATELQSPDNEANAKASLVQTAKVVENDSPTPAGTTPVMKLSGGEANQELATPAADPKRAIAQPTDVVQVANAVPSKNGDLNADAHSSEGNSHSAGGQVLAEKQKSSLDDPKNAPQDLKPASERPSVRFTDQLDAAKPLPGSTPRKTQESSGESAAAAAKGVEPGPELKALPTAAGQEPLHRTEGLSQPLPEKTGLASGRAGTDVPSLSVHSQAEPIPSSGSATQQVAGRLVPAEPPNMWSQVDKANVISQLIEKAQLLSSKNNSELVVSLKPEFLGRLSLHATMSENVLAATITAESPAVKTMLESQLPVLQQALQDQGLGVSKIVVVQGNDLSFGNFVGQQNHSGQQSATPQNHRMPFFEPLNSPGPEIVEANPAIHSSATSSRGLNLLA